MKFIHLLLSNLIGQNVQAMVQGNLQVVYEIYTTGFDQSDHTICNNYDLNRHIESVHVGLASCVMPCVPCIDNYNQKFNLT